MKFDRFMEHCFKILCLATAFVVAVGAVVSCTRPLRACAVEISLEEQAGINDFFEAYASNFNAIDFELNSDSDGNRNVRLQILGKQKIAYDELLSFYDNMDFSVSPDTVSLSAFSGGSALCYKANDSNVHYVTFCNGSKYLVSSDFFRFEVVNSANNNASYTVPTSGLSPGRIYGTSVYGVRDDHLIVRDTMGNISGQYSARLWFEGYHKVFCFGGLDRIPTISGSASQYFSDSTTIISAIGGHGVDIEIPSYTFDTISPWEYYNDNILPDILNNFDIDNISEYLVFPNGYSPESEPTESNYQTTNNYFIIPIIIGDPLPVDITDDLGNILDVLDILADLLPDGGLQIQIDGITLSFPRGGDSVVIDGTKYPLPLPDFRIDGHTINFPDNVHFDFDGIPFIVNSDGTITINGDTYNLPIGTPKQLSTDYDNYVYKYEIPTMEKINVVDATLSPVDLSSFADGVSGFYGLAARLYYDLGLFNPLIICLSVAAVGYAVSKIGGGH